MLWSAGDLETVACDFCGGDRFRSVFKRPDDLHAVECDSCGLCFLNPRPKMQEIRRLYGRGYFRLTEERNRHSGCGGGGYMNDAHMKRMLAQKRKRGGLLAPHLDFNGKRCLEIGCATGEFTRVLKEMGAHPLGIDPAEDAVEIARRRFPDIEFRIGGIDALAGNGRYDVILAFEVIEHVPTPGEFFRQVRDLLIPGGFFAMSTPNYGCARRIGPQNWVGLNEILEHIYFFDLDSLRMYGDRYGMKAFRWYSTGGSGAVRRGVAKTVRDSLCKLGFIGMARRARTAVTRTGEYSDKADRHGLHVIFERLT